MCNSCFVLAINWHMSLEKKLMHIIMKFCLLMVLYEILHQRNYRTKSINCLVSQTFLIETGDHDVCLKRDNSALHFPFLIQSLTKPNTQSAKVIDKLV